MRIKSFSVVLVPLLALACGSATTEAGVNDHNQQESDSGTTGNDDGGGHSSDGSTTGKDASGVTLGEKYLVHYDVGGYGDPGGKTGPICDSNGSLGAWGTFLAPGSLEYRSDWPADLNPYRVIAFAFLGSASAGLTPTQQSALVDWVKGGGTAFFVLDTNQTTPLKKSQDVVNPLLASIGIGIAIDGAPESPDHLGYMLPLDPSQPLGTGVSPFVCGTATFLTVTAPALALDATPPASGKAVIASQALGSGRVVVLSDATCVSDYYAATGTPPTYPDCSVTPSESASIGAFLKRLAGN